VSLTVVASSVDNAATNRKFLTDYLYEGTLTTPVIDKTTGQLLFLIIDQYTHRRTFTTTFKIFQCPPLDVHLLDGYSADFNHVAHLHNLKETMPLNKGHALRQATLQPKSIEKTSVKPAVSVLGTREKNILLWNS
jgi:hypothetical protein